MLKVYEGILNRLLAFGFTDESAVNESALQLEKASQDPAVHSVVISDEFMSQCIDVMEQFSITSPALRALLALLANLCLKDENRIMAVHFGVPGLCLALMQHVDSIPSDTLFYVFDLMSTMSANDAQARQNLRPCIPYVIRAMNVKSPSLDALFGASFLLSTLTILDASNCELIVGSGGMQALVNAYQRSVTTLAKLKKMKTPAASNTGDASVSQLTVLQRQKDADRTHVCEGIQRWARDTLRKLCSAPVGNVDEAIPALNFGVYGSVMAMDELKWSLTFDRKAFLKKINTSA